MKSKLVIVFVLFLVISIGMTVVSCDLFGGKDSEDISADQTEETPPKEGTLTVNLINGTAANDSYFFVYVYADGTTAAEADVAANVAAVNYGQIAAGTVSVALQEDDGEWFPNGTAWKGEVGKTYDVYIYTDFDDDGDPETPVGAASPKQLNPFPLDVTLTENHIVEVDYADFSDYVGL